MSTLNSSSTLDEIRAAYADNASYQEDESPTKARSFITACRLLLLHLPKRTAHSNRAEEVELQPELIAGEMKEATKWLTVHSAAVAAARSVYTNLQNFRD